MHSFGKKTVRHRRLLGAGLVAVATLAGSTNLYAQLSASGFGQAPTPPAAPAAQPPVIFNTGAAASSVAAERADFTIQIAETFSLRHDEGGLIKDVLASRPGIVQIDVDKDNASILKIKGVNVGVTQVTIVARDKDNKTLAPMIKTIQVNPDISYIRSKVAETFPTANLKIIAGGPPGSLIVTGTVESLEDIEPIRTFVTGIASQFRGPGASGGAGGQNDLVTFAVRVSGPQVVQLDVCLASVNRRELRRLGVDFFQRSGTNFLGTSIGGAGSLSLSETGIGSSGLNVQSTGANFIFRSQQGANSFIGFINALREERVGKVLSNPTLTALSGRPSRFIVGGEEPYGTAGNVGAGGGGGGAGVQFRPTGTVVGFLPVVLGDGRIRLTVAAENTVKTGDANQAGIIAPILATQQVGTTLELENGQSLVIGGLTENVVSGTSQKYPILGDLPFVGTFFRNVSFTEEEKEFVIVVKVNLVEGLTSDQRCAIKLPGTETRSPSDFELFIEGILEAPRGPRDIFPNRTYVPAFKNDVPFGARSGECSLPGPVCGHKGKHGHDCNTGTCNTGCTTVVPAQATTPVPHAAQMVPSSTVTPATAAPQTLTPVNTEVPVVSVPVVPASETPAPVVPAAETPKQVDLPVPPVPPLPPGNLPK
jgi:pilus assembly protein CpaC